MISELELTDTRTGVSVAVNINLKNNDFVQTVRNFAYACNGHLLADADREAQEAVIGSKLPPPLKGSAVLRISQNEMIEFGTSATASFFGGFFPDEVYSLQMAPSNNSNKWKDRSVGDEDHTNSSTGGEVIQNRRTAVRGHQPRVPPGQEDYSAGSLLMSNIGPNTNASRFIILLAPASDELRQNHVCFGHTARPSDLQTLTQLCKSIKVHPKTLMPVQKVIFTNCAIRRGGVAMATSRRGREEDDEEEAELEGKSSSVQRSLIGNAETGQKALKRRRGEVRISARPSSNEDDDNRNSSDAGLPNIVTTAAPTPSGSSFDMFVAQDAAFHNDILDIKESQQRKMYHRKNRAAKFAAHTQKNKRRY